MSIISWTSPRPSERILPASMDTSAPRSAWCSRSRFAQLAHELAADRARHGAPGRERVLGGADDRGHLGRRMRPQAGQLAAGDGRAGDQVAVGGNRHAEAAQDLGRLGQQLGVRGKFHGALARRGHHTCPSSAKRAPLLVASSASSGMSSWEMKPAPGSLPAATSSTTATADAAVVQEIARQTRPLMRSGW